MIKTNATFYYYVEGSCDCATSNEAFASKQQHVYLSDITVGELHYGNFDSRKEESRFKDEIIAYHDDCAWDRTVITAIMSNRFDSRSEALEARNRRISSIRRLESYRKIHL